MKNSSVFNSKNASPPHKGLSLGWRLVLSVSVIVTIVMVQFQPIAGRFKDYIAKPKPNGYKSIHTCVSTQDEQIFEVQIRSVAMHQMAEHGEASHFAYKKGYVDHLVLASESTTLIQKTFSMLRLWVR